jgi:hypothetical protein
MLVARRSGKGVKAQRKVYLLANGVETFVGYIFEPDGKGCGYAYRQIWGKPANTERFTSIKAAKIALAVNL